MADTPKANLVIQQGATFRHKFTWQDVKLRAVNLTGFSARVQVRATVEATDVLISLTDSNGGLTLGGTAGTVSLFMSDVQTSALTWAKGVYDIELVSPSNEVFRMVGGTVTVSPEVTR